MNIDLSRFRDSFFEEAADLLATMESMLLNLEAASADTETLNAVFRCAHSIKGSAGVFALDGITRFTHALESVLDRLRDGRLLMTHETVTLLLQSCDVLTALVAAAKAGTEDPLEVDAVIQQLNALITEDQPEVARVTVAAATKNTSAGHQYHIRFEPAPEIFRNGQDPLLVLRDLAQLGRVTDVKLDTSRVPPLSDLNAETCHLSWDLHLASESSESEIRDVFVFVEDGAVVSIDRKAETVVHVPVGAVAPPATGAVTLDSASVRVSTAKLDRIIDLVGELVIAQSIASQVIQNSVAAGSSALQEAMAQVERYTRELQERVMTTRMLPVGNVFSRFPRLVRDAAGALQKDVVLEMSGEDTELDKSMVERLTDPLTHLVRNSVDHGIETPEERRAAGKTSTGTVRLSARHEGGKVVIEVVDDGRGLDAEKIRQKAVEKGLIGADDVLTAEQIHTLIFHPGFSTKDSITNLSGRGVGMDVVKRNVDAMSGSIAVTTKAGAGTMIRIKLPLTLAIVDGLLVKAGAGTYVIPLVAIAESIQPKRDQVRWMSGESEVIVVRGEPLPLLRMHRLFGLQDAITDAARALVVVAEHDGARVALMVDELLGQQQVVVKSLEANYRKTEGVLGATILGDGRVALIIDIAGLVSMDRQARAA